MPLDSHAFTLSNSPFVYLCIFFCLCIPLGKRSRLGVPVIGVSTSVGGFGLRVLGVIANIFSTRELLVKGYRKYGLREKPFYIPQLEADNVLVPPAWIKAYKRAPASDLNLDGAIEMNLQVSYLLGPQIRRNSYHIDWSRDSLTNLLPSILPWLQEEIDDSLDDILPKDDSNFQKIQIFAYALALNCRIGARVLVGKPLCRNEVFLRLCEKHAQLLVILGMILKFLPMWCRPYVVKVSPLRGVQKELTDLMRPVILESYRSQKKDDKDSAENSLISSLIRTAISKCDWLTDEEAVVNEIAIRILNIMFLFTGSPTLVLANVLLDLMSQPKDLYHDALDTEIKSVFQSQDGKWTPDSLRELKLTDSFIKESMRLRPAALTIAGRKVINPSGYIAPDSSVTIPYGSYLTLPMYAVHRDKSNYPPRSSDGDDFDGFRFVDSSTGSTVPLVASSDTFLSWGAGRHICPGRFASAAITKMCLAQFILKCEYKPCERTEDRTFANIYVPSRKVVVELKRRE
ncbi:cytochrome P450 [Xylogone sp. PMI_703]|nr:cytochrome P450 [Xylogone sp. PMI_703]